MPSFHIRERPFPGMVQHQPSGTRGSKLRNESVQIRAILVVVYLLILLFTLFALSVLSSVLAYGEDLDGMLTDDELDANVAASDTSPQSLDLSPLGALLYPAEEDSDNPSAGSSAEATLTEQEHKDDQPAGDENAGASAKDSLPGGGSTSSEGTGIASGPPQMLSDEDLETVAASIPQVGMRLDLNPAGDISSGDLQKFFAAGNDLVRRNTDYFLNDLVQSSIDPSHRMTTKSIGKELTPHNRTIFKLKY